jgi:hypothetical protein
VSAAICQRFLRPGNGRIVVTTLVGEPDPGLVVRLYERVHERTPTLLDCRPIPLIAALPEAGFVERTVIHFSFGDFLWTRWARPSRKGGKGNRVFAARKVSRPP